jgi:tetratricopeptide (TPR) repeat protein
MADLCIRTGNPEIEPYTETIQRLYQKSNTYSQAEHIQRLRLLRGSKAFLENDLETAEKELIQYIANYDSEMDYDLGSAYLRLGKVYDLMGKRSEAIQQYQKVVDLDNRSHAVLEAQEFIVEPYRRVSLD